MSPDDSSGASDSSLRKTLDRLSVDDSAIPESSLRRVHTDLLGERDVQKIIKKSYSLENLNVDVKSDEDVFDTYERNGVDSNDSWVQFFSVPESSNNHTNNGALPNESSESSITLSRPVPVPRQTKNNNNNTTNQTNDATHPTTNEQVPRLQPRSNNQIISAEQTNYEQLLIELDTSIPADNIELDPLKTLDQLSSPQTIDRNRGSGQSMPIAKPRPSRGNVIPRSNEAVPLPESPFGPDVIQMRSKQPTPQNMPSSSSVVRADFIQADVSKPTVLRENRQGSLDQFDPLMTGQLIVDPYVPDKSRADPNRSQTQDEENLLKEWNLDFKYRGGGMPPPPHCSPGVSQAQMYSANQNAAFGSVVNRAPVYRPQYYVLGGQGYGVMAPPNNPRPTYMPITVRPTSNYVNTQSFETKQPHPTMQGYPNLYPNLASTTPNVRHTMNNPGAATLPRNGSSSLMQQYGTTGVNTGVRNGNAVQQPVDVNNISQSSPWEQFE